MEVLEVQRGVKKVIIPLPAPFLAFDFSNALTEGECVIEIPEGVSSIMHYCPEHSDGLLVVQTGG